MGSFYTWIRRAADSPATAIAVLVALCALSVAGTFIENEELNRVSLLKSAPAHFGILRVLDSHTYVRDTIYAPSSLGFGETETTPLPLRPFFTSQPDPIARIGREFRYQPQSPLKLSGFTLDEIAIVYTGMRGGEKIEESLWEAGAITETTPHPDVLRVIEVDHGEGRDVPELVKAVAAAAEQGNHRQIQAILVNQIPTFGPSLKSEPV